MKKEDVDSKDEEGPQQQEEEGVHDSFQQQLARVGEGDFATSHESSDTSAAPPPRPPPSIIGIPIISDTDEQSSAFSSVTTAHFQDADLFVPSMYPSLQMLQQQLTDPGNDSNNTITQENIQQHDPNRGEPMGVDNHRGHQSVGPPPKDQIDLESVVIQIDNSRLRLEKEKLSRNINPNVLPTVLESDKDGEPALHINEGEHPRTRKRIGCTKEASISERDILTSEDTDAQTVEEPEPDIELTVLKSQLQPKRRDSAVAAASSLIPNTSAEANESTRIGAFDGIMPTQITDHRRCRRGTAGPGAYAISASGGRFPHRLQHAEGGSQRENRQQCTETRSDQEEQSGDIESDLVEARPIPALQIATLQDEGFIGRGEGGLGADGKRFGFHQRNKVRAGICIAAIASACVLLGATLGTSFWAQDPAKVKLEHMRTAVTQAFGKEYFDNKRKERALRWMAFEDPQQSSLLTKEARQGSTNDHFIQRFSLVAFYFQSSFQNPWSFCTPPLESQSSLCYYISDPAGWTPKEIRSTRWLSAAHECEWRGVACTKAGGTKAATELRLNNNNMTGTLPTELTKLTNLQHLSFTKNRLSSTLPTWISALSALEVVDFRMNLFTGRTPQEYFLVPKLTELYLSNNLLTGPLPAISYASNLHRIGLVNNLLSGQFPSEIYSLTKLTEVWLYDNNLSGSLSPQVYKLSDLQRLVLNTNRSFGGSIPSEIGVLEHLKCIYIQETSIEGSIPSTLYGIKSLKFLALGGSKISGTISPRIGHFTKLEEFSVADTHISGTIPEEISRLSATLTKLHVERNPKLKGSIPNGYCLKRRQRLALGRVEIVADCTPSASTGGVPLVACPDGCCTSCCDAGTKICVEQ